MPSLDILGNEQGSSSNDDPSAFLLYHGASHVTGERLGEYLGIPHGRSTGSCVDYLIRWGSRSGAGWRPNEDVVNSRSALNDNTDKLDSLRSLENAGIPVPNYAEDRSAFGEEIEYPILGRARDHARGEDIELILQWRDAYLTDNDYFVEYIPTEFEYRAHVFDGEVIQVHEKRLRSEEDNHPYIRNAETGWVFVEPREEPPSESLAIDAVGALGLDFGAVDIVREENTGDEYVLEVNSAPSLDEANLERYGDAIADYVGLSEVNGLDAVDFSDEEDPEDADLQADEQEPQSDGPSSGGSSLFDSEPEQITTTTSSASDNVFSDL